MKCEQACSAAARSANIYWLQECPVLPLSLRQQKLERSFREDCILLIRSFCAHLQKLSRKPNCSCLESAAPSQDPLDPRHNHRGSTRSKKSLCLLAVKYARLIEHLKATASHFTHSDTPTLRIYSLTEWMRAYRNGILGTQELSDLFGTFTRPSLGEKRACLILESVEPLIDHFRGA